MIEDVTGRTDRNKWNVMYVYRIDVNKKKKVPKYLYIYYNNM